jgi:hypothetical protein
MTTFTTPSSVAVGQAARQPLRRLFHVLVSAAHALSLRWQRAQWDETTRYLSAAADHAELERRQRALERHGVRPPC